MTGVPPTRPASSEAPSRSTYGPSDVGRAPGEDAVAGQRAVAAVGGRGEQVVVAAVLHDVGALVAVVDGDLRLAGRVGVEAVGASACGPRCRRSSCRRRCTSAPPASTTSGSKTQRREPGQQGASCGSTTGAPLSTQGPSGLALVATPMALPPPGRLVSEAV